MVIDITEKMLSALSVNKKNFNQAEWSEAWSKFIGKRSEFVSSWDEPGDIWVEITYAKIDELAFVFSRDFPFVFCSINTARTMEEFRHEIYSSYFSCLFIESWDIENYKIDIKGKISDGIKWHSSGVDPSRFSIRDFLYATH